MSDIIPVSFDGFVLNEMPFKITNWTPSGSPTKATKNFRLARAHGLRSVFESFDAPVITLMGQIICSSKIELDNNIDNLKAWMRRPFGTLSIGYGSGARTWVAKPTHVNIPRDRENISYTPFTIDFELESPFAKDGNMDLLVDAQTITTSVQDMSVLIGGTMDGQPIISINIVAFNPSNIPKSITVANPSASQYLTITDQFVAGDVINIDCEKYIVTINESAVYASGQFPLFPIGPGLLQYSDDATTRDVVLTATNERKFL